MCSHGPGRGETGLLRTGIHSRRDTSLVLFRFDWAPPASPPAGTMEGLGQPASPAPPQPARMRSVFSLLPPPPFGAKQMRGNEQTSF